MQEKITFFTNTDAKFDDADAVFKRTFQFHCNYNKE